MPSPNTQERNARLRQAYKKLSNKKVTITFSGVKVSFKLTPDQKLQVLAKGFFLAPRTVEDILGSSD